MVIKENVITLKPLKKEDVNIFIKWLDKEYINKWFCPEGEEERQAWLDEVNNLNGKYNHLKHFIVNYNHKKIGYCLYMDIHFEPEYSQEIYKTVFDKNHAYEIGFLIGEEEYLNKGIGKIIIKKLEKKIIEIGGKEILADPSQENILSIKTLLCNGFIKIKNGDYRKKL
jgi:RimJ/RimL family protein N-acetyltransferase